MQHVGSTGLSLVAWGIACVIALCSSLVYAELAPMIPSLLPGIQSTANLFVKQLMRRLALRLAEDLRPESESGKATNP